MGHSYSTLCESCFEQEVFLLGIGFSSPHTPTMIIEASKNKNEKAFLKYIINNRNAKLTRGFGLRLYECCSCETIHVRYQYEFTYDYNETYNRIFRCGKCSTYLTPLIKDFNIKNYRCKKCNRKGLSEGLFQINWD